MRALPLAHFYWTLKHQRRNNLPDYPPEWEILSICDLWAQGLSFSRIFFNGLLFIYLVLMCYRLSMIQCLTVMIYHYVPYVSEKNLSLGI